MDIPKQFDLRKQLKTGKRDASKLNISQDKPKRNTELMKFEQMRNNINIFNYLQEWNNWTQLQSDKLNELKGIISKEQLQVLMWISGIGLSFEKVNNPKFGDKWKEEVSDIVPQGLLIYWQMGMGKTRCFIASSLFTLKFRSDIYEKNSKILIVINKSLQQQVQDELSRYIGSLKKQGLDFAFNKDVNADLHQQAADCIQFITFNDTQNFASDVELQFKDLNIFSKKIIIIDECQNLFRSIYTNSKRGNVLYERLMNDRKSQILLASGTPFLSHPEEIVICYQILSRNAKLLDRNTFSHFFIQTTSIQLMQERTFVKNKDILIKRISGLSHIAAISNSKDFPVLKPIQIRQLQLINPQLDHYKEQRKKEIQGASFMQGSRIASNVYISSNIKEQLTNNTYTLNKQIYNTAQKFELNDQFYKKLNRIPINANLKFFNNTEFKPKLYKQMSLLQRLQNDQQNQESDIQNDGVLAINNSILIGGKLREQEIYSVKYQALVEFIENNKKTKHIVYSSFVQNGTLLIPQFAKQQGFHWEEFGNNNQTTNIIYMNINGNVNQEKRFELIQQFNNSQNANGQLCQVLFLSPASIEGINVRCVQYVHILEPQWTYSSFEQIIYRAVRNRSHLQLTEQERFVQPILYIAYDKNEYQMNNYEIGMSTDQVIFYKSKKQAEFIGQMTNLLKFTSINSCSNKDEQCFRCANTEMPKQLFSPLNILDDFKFNSCIQPVNIQQKNIIKVNQVYYIFVENIFSTFGVDFYEQRDDMRFKIQEDNPIFADLLEYFLQQHKK